MQKKMSEEVEAELGVPGTEGAIPERSGLKATWSDLIWP